MRRFRSAFEFARSSSRECLRRYGPPVLISARSFEDEGGRGINGFTATPTGEEAILEFRLFKQFCEPSEPVVAWSEPHKRRRRTMSETEVRLRRPPQSANPSPQQQQPPMPPPVPRCSPSPDRRVFRKPSSSASRSSAKLRDCTVVLLDGSEAPFKIDPSSRGQALFDLTCDFLCLTERHYFGLCYKDPASGVFEWLYNDKRLSRQLDPNGGSAPWRVDFSVKFYPLKPETLTDAQARSCMALQVRQNLIAGRLSCSFTGYALLGSYLMQTELGDWADGNDRAAAGCQFCPEAALRADPELLRQARQLHQCHLGLASRDAERRLLENARKLATYGLDIHEAASGGEAHLVGVCGDGIILMRPESLLRTARFTWPRVTALTRRGREVCVTLRQASGNQAASGGAGATVVRLRCGSPQSAQRLWRSAVEHHGFFRLKSRDKTTTASRPLIQSGTVRISRSISQSYAVSTGSLGPEESAMVPIQKRASSLNRYSETNGLKAAVLVTPEDMEDSVRLDGRQDKEEASVRSNLKLLTATDQKAASRRRSSSRRSCSTDGINRDVQLRVLPKEAPAGKRDSAVALNGIETEIQQSQQDNPSDSSVFQEPHAIASGQVASEVAETETIVARSDCAMNGDAGGGEKKEKKKKKKHRHRKERQSDSEDKPKKSSRSRHRTTKTPKSKQAETENQLQQANQTKQEDPEYQSHEAQQYQQDDPEYQPHEAYQYQQDTETEYQPHKAHQYQQDDTEYQPHKAHQYQQDDTDTEYQSHEAHQYQQEDLECQPPEAHRYQQEDLEYQKHNAHPNQLEKPENQFQSKEHYKQYDEDEGDHLQNNLHQQPEYPDQMQSDNERQHEFLEHQQQGSLGRQEENLERQSTAVECIDDATDDLSPEKDEANLSHQMLPETMNQLDPQQRRAIKPQVTEDRQNTPEQSLEDQQKLQQQMEPPPLLTLLSSPTRQPPSGEETPNTCDTTSSSDQAFFRTSAFATDATVEAASVQLAATRQPKQPSPDEQQLLTLLDAMKKSAGNAATSAVKQQVASACDEETNRVSVVETMTETTEIDAPVEELISFTDQRGNPSVRRVVRHRKIRVIVTDTVVESPLSSTWHSHPEVPRNQTHSALVEQQKPPQQEPNQVRQQNLDEGYV